MRLCLIRMPPGRGVVGAEVAVVVPGTRKLAMMVPLVALPDFLGLLYEAMRDQGEQRCPACTEPLVPVPSAEVDHA